MQWTMIFMIEFFRIRQCQLVFHTRIVSNTCDKHGNKYAQNIIAKFPTT
jgi:hypothetical protein